MSLVIRSQWADGMKHVSHKLWSRRWNLLNYYDSEEPAIFCQFARCNVTQRRRRCFCAALVLRLFYHHRKFIRSTTRIQERLREREKQKDVRRKRPHFELFPCHFVDFASFEISFLLIINKLNPLITILMPNIWFGLFQFVLSIAFTYVTGHLENVPYENRHIQSGSMPFINSERISC